MANANMKAQPIKVFNASWWIIACLRLFKLSQSCCCRLRHNCCCCCRLCNTCNTNKSAKDDWKDFEWESYSLSSFLPTLNCSLRVVVPVKREGKWQSQLCEAVAQAVGSLLPWKNILRVVLVHVRTWIPATTPNIFQR